MEASPSREYSAIGTGIERKTTQMNRQLSEQLLEVQTDKEESDDSKDLLTSDDDASDEDFTKMSGIHQNRA